MHTFKHWRLEKDEFSILWIHFDKAGSKVNTLDLEIMAELESIFTWLATTQEYIGVILLSDKSSGFCPGADISLFQKLSSVAEAESLLKRGQSLLSKIEAFPIPILALIEGPCLGGGLELALACHYRIAEDGLKTRLGLPEVKLGIHPGWGGSVRLPKLIGAMNGLNLVLAGNTVSAKAAYKLGLVDAAVPKRHLLRAAQQTILKKPRRHQATLLQSLSNKNPIRKLLAHFFRKKLNQKVSALHYPAPFQVLNNWEEVGVEGELAFDKEAESCAKLFFSETSRNLVRVFFLQERLKSLGKEIQFQPQHVHVIGAGTMGGDIAAWCALQGMTVTLQDREPQFIAPAIKRAYQLYKDKLKETHLIQNAMDRLIPDIDGHGIAKADVIIEAIFEDLAVKQALFKNLEAKAKPDAILATNTSSIPLDEINKVLTHPERLVGIHFFNPVPKMQLVEVVKGECTDLTVFQKATAFARKLDRLPLPVKSSPGFLINRILMPYLMEAMVLLEEGVPATIIDKSMIEFGMPMGPIMLADTVGLDVCLSVANYLATYFNMIVPTRLVMMVEKGQLGRKTGKGFYQYRNGKPILPSAVSYDKPLEELADRLVLRMLNEAFACLREGVVEDGDLLDAGMIFGTGFAPFRGGPIHYAKSKGIKDLYKQYLKIHHQQGREAVTSQSWELNSVNSIT